MAWDSAPHAARRMFSLRCRRNLFDIHMVYIYGSKPRGLAYWLIQWAFEICMCVGWRLRACDI